MYLTGTARVGTSFFVARVAIYRELHVTGTVVVAHSLLSVSPLWRGLYVIGTGTVHDWDRDDTSFLVVNVAMGAGIVRHWVRVAIGRGLYVIGTVVVAHTLCRHWAIGRGMYVIGTSGATETKYCMSPAMGR